MASPWKFLARLTSRRPQRVQDTAGDDGASQALNIDEATEPAFAEYPNATAAPEEQGTASETNEPERGAATLAVSGDVDRAKSGKQKSPDLDSSVTTTHDTPLHAPAKDVAASPRKRRKASKGATPTAVLPSKEAPDGYAELQTLDEEIGRLRRELVKKLQLQNAQLKKMIERFS